jgi:hypothetical protein
VLNRRGRYDTYVAQSPMSDTQIVEESQAFSDVHELEMHVSKLNHVKI